MPRKSRDVRQFHWPAFLQFLLSGPASFDPGFGPVFSSLLFLQVFLFSRVYFNYPQCYCHMKCYFILLCCIVFGEINLLLHHSLYRKKMKMHAPRVYMCMPAIQTYCRFYTGTHWVQQLLSELHNCIIRRSICMHYNAATTNDDCGIEPLLYRSTGHSPHTEVTGCRARWLYIIYII